MPNRWGPERYLELGPRSCLQASEGRRLTKLGERLLSPLREFAFLPLVTALALSTSSAAQEASQGAGLVAMGVEAYAASKVDCYYRPEVGDALEKLQDYFSSQTNGDWETLRAEARKQLVVANNMASLASKDPYNASVAQQCRVYGSAVGLALGFSLVVIKPDRVIVAESDRLNNGGARVVSEVAGQTQRVETPPAVTPPSGQFTNGAGTNMGPGYRSTYGRPPEAPRSIAHPTTPLTPTRPISQFGTLEYGDRTGEEVEVINVVGLDTEHAMIVTTHTRPNALAYCREQQQVVTQRCIADELGKPLRTTIYANCKTGTFVDFFGAKFQYGGRRLSKGDEGTSAKYKIVDVKSGQVLSGDTASGYPTAMRIFNSLCPINAPSDY